MKTENESKFTLVMPINYKKEKKDPNLRYCQNADCDNRGKQYHIRDLDSIQKGGFWLLVCKDCYKIMKHEQSD